MANLAPDTAPIISDEDAVSDAQPPQPRHDVQILYGDDGHPILLIVEGRQYVVGHGARRERPPPIIGVSAPVAASSSSSSFNGRNILIVVNLLLVAFVALQISGGVPQPVIELGNEALDWVCQGRGGGGGTQETEDQLLSHSVVVAREERVCMCGEDFGGLAAIEGGRPVSVIPEWPLHTPETFSTTTTEWKGAGFVTDTDIKLRSFDLVVRTLAAHASREGDTESPLLCMHHLAHTHAESARVCVLSRRARGSRSRQVFPLYNLDLKGYSNESTPIPETSVVCGAIDKRSVPITRSRRLVVDIAYTTVGGAHMRSLLDDPAEAFAVQRVWEEFRGTYAC